MGQDTRVVSEQSEPLGDYLKLKLELADLLRSAMELLRQRQDDARLHRARALLADLAEDRFKLAVVGQFKRGKSSLMNAVLGMDRLPTGILPLTSVVTTVRYGDRERLLVQRRGWSLPQEVPLGDLEAYVTEKGNPGNRKQVVQAEFLLPVELLRLGFSFIDTPGVASPVAANTRTTERFLPEADAVIFVTSFESTLNESELAFLQSVRQHVHRIFFVLNKADLASALERDEVVNAVRERLRTELDIDNPRIFTLSARHGLASKLAQDGENLAQSGLPEFERALTEFLTTGRTHDFLVRTAERGIGLLTRERLEYRLASMTAVLGASTQAELIGGIAGIRDEQRAIIESVRARIETVLPALFQPEIRQHCSDLQRDIGQLIDHALSQYEVLDMAPENGTVPQRAQAICDQRSREWETAHRQEIVEALTGIAREDLGRLEGSLDRASRASAEILGFSGPTVAQRISGGEDWFRWGAPPPIKWGFRTPWELDILPFKWLRARVRLQLQRSVEAALAEYEASMLRGLAAAGRDWVDRLDREVENAMDMFTPPIAEVAPSGREAAVIHESRWILDRLVAFLRKLNGETGTGAHPSTATAPDTRPARAAAACIVCQRLVAGLFEFLRKQQYELTVNETERRTHTASGGFCPLHAWQYEKLATPRGVCVAYAPLLESRARHLRATAAAASSAAALRNSVRELVSGGKCRACQVAVRIEDTAMELLSAKLAAEETEGVTLCLPHLYAALARQTEVGTARRLVTGSAYMLDRIAQHMELYALKHDAVRRDLATEQEWNAHMQGLSLLVGHRRLSSL